jgi:glycosyltransferase involved in cell wall biosynthesis
MKLSSNIKFPGAFTVLMALYRGDDSLLFKRAVNSVFVNTLLPKELLLVVDGPITAQLESDLEGLELLYGEKLKVIRLMENKGLAMALNYGLNFVSTSWVVRADADDINLGNRFRALATMVQNNPCLDLVGSAILEIDERGVALSKRVMPKNESDIRAFAIRRNPFNHMTVAFRLDVVQGLGGYPNIHLKEDYGLWCMCIAAGARMSNTDEILVWASTGVGMYKRRGGCRHAKSEYSLQKLMVNLGLKNGLQAMLDGFTRSIFFLIPTNLRGFIYIKMFRQSINEKFL